MFSSNPLPTTSCFARSASFVENSSAIDSWTIIRLAHTHVCPALRNFVAIVWFTATSISASSATINGACPPSSIVTFFTVSALAFINNLPTGVEPVKVNFFMRGLSVKNGPTKRPSPFTHWITSSGNPASCANSMRRIVVNGVSSAGLTIKVHPAANAGAAFRVIIAAGKFQGVIAATSPIGCFVTISLFPSA